MLEVINRYIHGYVSIPVILACRKKGLFKYFKEKSCFTLQEITKDFNANEGHLQVALRLFESLGWLTSDRLNYQVCMTSTLFKDIEILPKQALFIYQTSLKMLFHRFNSKRNLCYWLKEGLKQFSLSSPLQDFLEGVFVVPLLINLRRYFLSEAEDPGPLILSELSPKLKQSVASFLIQKGWGKQKEEDIFLTNQGQFMLERELNMATAASYAPMLNKMFTLLFGNCASIFNRKNKRGESHVDRHLNVLASGFQHEKYFSDMDEVILSIFNQEPLSEQPRYIIDMGCGDGTLLKRIYHLVRRSRRGNYLTTYPIFLIGVDFNQASLLATEHNLKGLPHRTLQGDINNPKTLLADLHQLGLDHLDKILHVRSFLDHDRPFVEPRDLEALKERGRLSYDGVYVDKKGHSISPVLMVQSLVEHFKRWADIVTHHGLMVLEVHSLKPQTILAYLDDNESLHFDAYHAFSGQNLVSADVFLMAAAEAGLFPKLDWSKRYPRVFPYTRITLNYFEKKPYTFEHAREADIAALMKLETECWPASLQLDATRLSQRLKLFPEGQIVARMNGQVVAVVYTQRISDVAHLKGAKFESIHSLHDSNGPIIQLLAINVSLREQDRGLGGALLSFILFWASLKSDVEKVVGITRCLNYKNYTQLSLSEYISQQHDEPKKLDPILRFHVSRGAKIIGVLPNYRPEDIDNQGSGILIEYELRQALNPVFYSNELKDIYLPEKIVKDKIYSIIVGLLPLKHNFDKNFPLREMGFDSLGLLELRALLEKNFSIKLHPSFFFEYSTPKAIAQHLGQTVKVKVNPSTAPHAVFSERTLMEPVAIVGIACRFPVGVKTPKAFWKVLEENIDSIVEVPESRWKKTDYPEFSIHRGGFLEDVDKFDAAFFNISPSEAELMDPQQRLLLEVSWEALENGGISVSKLRGGKVGVYVGIFSHDYEQLINKNQPVKDVDAYFATGNSASIAAGRIAYIFGFQGPAMSVNTACSSSLVAVHLACQSLRQGESELALACGVNLILSPELSISFAKAGMLSEDGRCKTFDVSANGYGRSEGCAVVVLKKLSKALMDGDNILAVLRNSVINQDGASNGLTAPNKSAQVDLLKSVFTGTNLSPARVDYIEAHGTGTILGDPIEVSAIAAAYGYRETPLVLGSVKANIGHTEAVAGLAGLIKVVLALKHKIIPANPHFTRLNSHISLEAFKGQIPEKNLFWPQEEEKPRLAAVSSFGFSGTNAHALIEEGPEYVLSTEQHKPYYLVTLSAKHVDSLKQRVEDLSAYLHENLDLPIEAIAYTLNVKRSHFNHRLAVVASSTKNLQEKLEQLRNHQKAKGFFSSQIPQEAEDSAIYREVFQTIVEEFRNFNLLDTQHYESSLETFGNLYVKGYELDWSLLHQGENHQIVDLPTYPFLKKRYWVSEVPRNSNLASFSTGKLPSASSQPTVHPLVEINASTLGSLSFKTYLTGEEFYLKDHIVGGQKILPGVVYLEMARAAGELALPGKQVKAIQEVVWLKPVVIEEAPQVLYLQLEHKGVGVGYTIYSMGQEEMVHSQGMLLYEEVEKKNWENIEKLSRRLPEEIQKKDLYQRYAAHGLRYGESFQAVQWVKRNGAEALGYYQGALPEGFRLAPNLLDTALQVGIALDQGQGLSLPFALEALTIQKPLSQEGYVHVKSNNNRLDLQVLNAQGEVCVELKGLSVRPFKELKTTELIFYQPNWEEAVLEDKVQLNTLCVLNDKALAKQLRTQHPELRVITLTSSECYQQEGDDYELRINIEDCQAFIDGMREQGVILSHFIVGQSKTKAGVQEYVDKELQEIVVLIRSLMRAKVLSSTWVVAYDIDKFAPEIMLTGFARSIYREHPGYQIVIVGLEQDSPDAHARILFREFASQDFHVRYQPKRQVQRYVRSVARNEETLLRQGGVYLITGGLGGLGSIFAEYLAKEYQAKLVLTGRSNPNNRLKQLENQGASVLYLQGDVCDYTTVESWIEQTKSYFGNLHGIIHSAGIIADKLLLQKEWQTFKTVLLPKVIGAFNLDKATQKDSLDCFLVFSSIAGCLGNIGQSDYASANAFLDYFMSWRADQVKQGLRRGKSLAIDWPYWIEGGMQVDEATEKGLQLSGMQPLPTAQGLQAFKLCLGSDGAHQIVCYGDSVGISSFIKEAQTIRKVTTQIEGEVPEPLKQDLIKMIADVLKLSLNSIDIIRELTQYGFDSIGFTKLANQLKKYYQISITPALFFEYSTIESFSRYLWQHYRSVLLQYYAVDGQRSALIGVENHPVKSQTKPLKLSSIINAQKWYKLGLTLNQQQLYALYLLNPIGNQYNVKIAIELKGDLSLPILQKALDFMIARHDSLRMNFILEENSPEIRVHPSLSVDILTEDFSSLIGDQKRQAVDELIHKLYEQPFDLAKDPLLRCHVVKLGKMFHVLIVIWHHTITDGWSIGLFIKEFAQYYNALDSNVEYQPPPLPASYTDFIQWQKNLLTPEREQTILNFWQRRLQGSPDSLPLPRKGDYKSPSIQRGSKSIKLSKALNQALKTLADSENVSLFVCLLSAYQVLLARYSEQSDIIVGVPFFGREEAAFQETQGYFINMLPLRVQLSDLTTFAKLLQKNSQFVKEAQEHQPLPLAKLLSILKVPRNMDQQPLFQVSFNLFNVPFPKLKLAGVQARTLWRQGGQTDYDLAMEAMEEDGQLQLTLNYNANWFDQAFIHQFLHHYVHVLENVVLNAHQFIWSLELMDAKEKHKILVDWNATEKNYSKDKFFHQWVEEQAEKLPDKVALLCEDEQLTYQTLNIKANQLSHYLREQGVKPDTLVAIACERSFEMIIGALGILKAGGAYVPLDPSYPKERIQFILEDTQAPLLLTQENVLDKLPETKAQIFLLDKNNEGLKGYPNTNPVCMTQSQHLAYVIYTSGSTGKPKGVMVEHRGINNLAQAQSELFEIDSNSRVLQFASMTFDAAISELATSFSQGATLCLIKSKESLAGEALFKAMEAMGVTVATLPPTVLATLPGPELPILKTLVIAGEAAPQSLVDKWQQKVRLLNAYGPTEATVCASVASYRPGMNANIIGKPMANVQLYILDGHQQPVPVGVTGELYIGGVGLARGYLNQPELTYERFIANPLINEEEQAKGRNTRLYRTGDVARYLSDGNIEYLGRIDQQVKLRGYRVELGEIERVLRAQPSIKEAVVVLRQDNANDVQDKRLVAYILLKQQQAEIPLEGELSVLTSQWREVLRARLPEYMIPSAFMVLDRFPLTPSHKLDRKALPMPDTLYRSAQQPFIPPRNALEQKIARLWSEILSLNPDQISMEDNFFLLGGNSLSSLQLLQGLKQILKMEVTLADIFQHPTIAGLARREVSSSSGAPRKKIQGILPIKAQGAPALFLVHPIGGLCFAYLPLAKYLSGSLYGLQNPYFGQDKRFSSVDEWVDCYIEQMKAIQPKGPYQLGGWSLGGNIALLMAQKLKKQGEPINQVILIDSFNPLPVGMLAAEEEQHFLQTVVSQWQIPGYQNDVTWLNAVRLEIENSIQLLSQSSYPISYKGTVNLIKADPFDLSKEGTPVTLKRLRSLQTLAADPYNGWKTVLPQIAVSMVPGTHYELFSEHLMTTAKALQEVLGTGTRVDSGVEKTPALEL